MSPLRKHLVDYLAVRRALTVQSSGKEEFTVTFVDPAVAAAPHEMVLLTKLFDGQPPGAARGLDVDEHGAGTAVDRRLYQLIRQRGSIVDRTFEIAFLDAGVEAFSFTFG